MSRYRNMRELTWYEWDELQILANKAKDNNKSQYAKVMVSIEADTLLKLLELTKEMAK